MAFFAADRIKVSTTTTGTDDFGIGSAVSTAFHDFTDVPNGARLQYTAYTATAFECGEGVYDSSGPTLSRSTIYASSNSGNKTSFGSSPVLSIAPLAASVRRLALGAFTRYVRTGGADDTDHYGIENTDADAWATVDYAVARMSRETDYASQTATLSIQSATITDEIFIGFPNIVDSVGGGVLILDFNGGTLAPSGDAVTIFQVGGPQIGFKNVTISSSAGAGINLFGRAYAYIDGSVTFGVCANQHIYVDDQSYWDGQYANYSITGNAASHIYVNQGALAHVGGTITLTGTPNFGDAFAVSEYASVATLAAATFVGGATGKRYRASVNGVIRVDGGGASFLPGNAAGTTDTGGQYL